MDFKKFHIIATLLILLFSKIVNAQVDSYYEDEYLYPINDKSLEGQKQFVEELLDLSGYIIKKIIVYQKLPENAKVFQVKLESSERGGFIFVRWDKKKQENYVDNKLIDSGIYYNLKAAKEIMRKQTEQASFGVDEVAIQAQDQEKISKSDLEKFREEFDLKEKEKEVKKINLENKKVRKRKKEKQLTCLFIILIKLNKSF